MRTAVRKLIACDACDEKGWYSQPNPVRRIFFCHRSVAERMRIQQGTPFNGPAWESIGQSRTRCQRGVSYGCALFTRNRPPGLALLLVLFVAALQKMNDLI